MPFRSPRLSRIICTRSAAEKTGSLLGFSRTAITTRSKMLADRSRVSRWPRVTGSKLPGYSAVVILDTGRNSTALTRSRAGAAAAGARVQDSTPSDDARQPPAPPVGAPDYRAAGVSRPLRSIGRAGQAGSG